MPPTEAPPVAPNPTASPAASPAATPATAFPAFPADTLHRLARLVLNGDVVFFVGAGYSIDSEWNTGQRLIRRLLIRLEAFAEVLGGRAVAIRNGLRSTFELSPSDPVQPPKRFPYVDDGKPTSDINKLFGRYFETNDWFCRAFAEMLAIAAQEHGADDKRSRLVAALHCAEECIRTRPQAPRAQAGAAGGGATDGGSPVDAVPIETEGLAALIDWAAQVQAQSEASPTSLLTVGKALFLDTMGFRNPSIMAGRPDVTSLNAVRESFGDRLLPRHHVLARFARDGLCTTTVTTNFDLLLEGAFRLSGFAHRTTPDTDAVPPTLFSAYAPIASPVQFFEEGKAHRTPVLVKMHGCAGSYRRLNLPRTNARPVQTQLQEYLKSMVFTYREIQNWREDAWAADFLRTLLRTRTVVFAGYSLQDPVVHDTFRTVYEEMARIRRTEFRALGRSDPAAGGDPAAKTVARPARGPEHAPAFFLELFDPDRPDRKPFHALEVLNAASDAVGASRAGFGEHPNFVHFHKRTRTEFPNLDEVCEWVAHAVLRLRQQECLHNDLQRALTALHGRPRPEIELQKVRRRFDQLLVRERAAARQWRTDSPAEAALARRQHGRLCAWSDSFHAGLLREFAAIDQLRRTGGLGLELTRQRRHGWYYPMMQDAVWTCWGAVVEIALRRMIAWVLRPFRAVFPGAERLWAGTANVPTVLFQRPLTWPPRKVGATAAVPPPMVLQALAIQFGASDIVRPQVSLYGHPAHTCVWLLREQDAPWRPTVWRDANPAAGRPAMTPRDPSYEPVVHRAPATVVRHPPPANILWRWASGTESPKDRARARRWLGLTSQ